jgi:hypothetical protein
MTEHDAFCETCSHRAPWVIAAMGPPARLAFFCEEHIGLASLAPLAAIEDAVLACFGARDGALAAVWQSVSDRYPEPVRLDADLRARAGIPSAVSWDIIRRPPMSVNQIGITTRIQSFVPGDHQPHDDADNGV